MLLVYITLGVHICIPETNIITPTGLLVCQMYWLVDLDFRIRYEVQR